MTFLKGVIQITSEPVLNHKKSEILVQASN